MLAAAEREDIFSWANYQSMGNPSNSTAYHTLSAIL